MKLTIEEFKDAFDNAENDEKRWELVRDNQHLNITVLCDNDSTHVSHNAEIYDDEDENFDEWYGEFDSYIGWTDGVFELLHMLNIKADCV